VTESKISNSLGKVEETKIIQLKKNLDQMPLLSEFDIESDTEENHVDENLSIKPKKKRTTTWFTANTPSQTKFTSKKSSKKQRLEIIRKGSLLPDDIWLSNHMPCNQLSNEEFNANCRNLKKTCKSLSKCTAHTSLKNLKVISGKLKEILSQEVHLSKDWIKEKKLHSGKHGYLDIAVNYPEIWDQTKIIKKRIMSFNNGREKIIKYKDLVLNYKANDYKPTLSNPKCSPIILGNMDIWT
jgi:hypothetical protein